jgi:hypothetical protein
MANDTKELFIIPVTLPIIIYVLFVTTIVVFSLSFYKLRLILKRVEKDDSENKATLLQISRDHQTFETNTIGRMEQIERFICMPACDTNPVRPVVQPGQQPFPYNQPFPFRSIPLTPNNCPKPSFKYQKKRN